MSSKTAPKLLSILLVAFTLLLSWSSEGHGSGKSEGVKHILLFIGDGMELEHEIAAGRYLYGIDRGLSFHNLAYRGFVATWDVPTYNRYAHAAGAPPYDEAGFHPNVGYDPSRGGRKPYPEQTSGIDHAYFLAKLSLSGGGPKKHPATDSASAATAWATGIKTDDGNIAWAPGDPPDGALTTIAELLRESRGFSIGVVSTVPFSHATPAAHVSHNVHRNNYAEIAREIIRTLQPEVVIGAGYPGSVGGASAGFRYLSREDYEYLKSDPSSPYVLVERQAGADGALSLREDAQRAAEKGMKLFGLFGGPQGNFESPVAHDSPGAPLVTRATVENPLLKDAVLAALEVLSRNREGFFVMIEQGDIDWANHANDFRRMIGTVWDLHMAVEAAIDFIDRPGDPMDWSNTLMIVTSDHGNSFMRLHKELKAGGLPFQKGTCGYRQPPCTYPNGEVAYGSTDHTNELVMLYAHGAFATEGFKEKEGAWYPCTRIIDNTQLFHIMAEAAGVPRPSRLSPNIQRPAACE
jgi:alkaline phosphatase